MRSRQNAASILLAIAFMRRRKFTPAQKAFVIQRQHGRCDETGVEFMEGDAIEFDHRIPLALGGEDTLENLRAVLAVAHARKTKGDIWQIAKMKRQRGDTGQRARRARRKAEGKGPLMQGRGFDKTKTRKMSGLVVERQNAQTVRRDREPDRAGAPR
jgi:hypothetical protein